MNKQKRAHPHSDSVGEFQIGVHSECEKHAVLSAENPFVNTIALNESSSIFDLSISLTWLCSLSPLCSVCFVTELITECADEPIHSQMDHYDSV